MWPILSELAGILNAMLAVWPIISTSNFPTIFIRAEYQWHLFRSNNQLHMSLLCVASCLLVGVGSTLMIGTIMYAYLPFWLENIFSIPLKTSIMVMLLIIATPALIGGLPLLYIKRFPPDKWMNNRIARLSI